MHSVPLAWSRPLALIGLSFWLALAGMAPVVLAEDVAGPPPALEQTLPIAPVADDLPGSAVESEAVEEAVNPSPPETDPAQPGEGFPEPEPLALPLPVTPVPEVGKIPARAKKNVPEMPLVHHRKRRDLNHIYQFDREPLGDRIPVILVPGRAEEFQQNSWWKGFREESRENEYFDRYFKLYAYIYDSRQELDVQAGEFDRELKKYFWHLPESQPLMMVVYSLGGVIAREAFADPAVLDRVDTVVAIAVPFHGSPLFDPDWFSKYMRPPNRSPVRKFWDRMIYRAYMFNKSNLTRGLRWDNFDSSKPQFEPNKIDVAGDQIIPKIAPFSEYPLAKEMKEKMIVYASYLENGYTHGNQPLNPRKLPGYVLQNSVNLPKELVATVLPLYGFTVHSVFTYMNNQLSRIPTYTPENPEGKETHLYRYNDGAIPLSSMMFLPPSLHPYDQELSGLIEKADVRKVRIFVNIDHMHIGEYSMFKNRLVREDIIHPADGKRSPHDWVIYDLLNRVEFGMQPRPPVLAAPRIPTLPE